MTLTKLLYWMTNGKKKRNVDRASYLGNDREFDENYYEEELLRISMISDDQLMGEYNGFNKMLSKYDTAVGRVKVIFNDLTGEFSEHPTSETNDFWESQTGHRMSKDELKAFLKLLTEMIPGPKDTYVYVMLRLYQAEFAKRHICPDYKYYTRTAEKHDEELVDLYGHVYDKNGL